MIHATSRYARDNVVVEESGRLVVLPRRRLPLADYPDDDLVTVTPGATLWNLADRFGLGPEQWWVIAERNGIRDATEPLEPGTVLRIPSRRTLHEVVMR